MRRKPREGKHHHETLEEVLYERRLLKYVTGVVGIGVLTWFVAISTDYWIIAIKSNSTETLVDPNVVQSLASYPAHDRLFLWSHSGLWTKCSVFRNTRYGSDFSECEFHDLTGSSAVADLMRAELCLCIMTILLIILALVFSVYSLIHPRYTFKRIAGCLHLITALCMISLFEMVKTDTHRIIHDHEDDHMLVMFGYSYLLGWIVLIIFILACIAFFAGSRKRKTLPYDFETALS